MAVPDFQTVMRPLLVLLSDKKERQSAWLYEKISDEFGLTSQEREELLPSGKQAIINNRVAWSLFHLKIALLVGNSRRGIYRITRRGLGVLNSNRQRVDMRVLSQFPEYVKVRASSEQPETGEISETPVLAEQAPILPPEEAEDKLGLDVIYLQAKRWDGTVGRPTVQGFVGAIHGARATKGVIITTSDFSAEARDYVRTIPTRIVLADGTPLAELMIDHNVAVSRVSNYETKKVDNDYFFEL